MKSPSKKTTALVTGGVLGLSFAASAVSLRRIYYRRPDLFPDQRPWVSLPAPGAAKKVGIVYNPSKERAQAALNIVYRSLAKAGWEPAKLYETEVDDPGFSMAQQAVQDGAKLVLAVGGDGTVREVASALKDTGVPMGIVPMGTGNLLARNLGYDVWDTNACVQFALFGKSSTIDMIHLVTELVDGDTDERNFLVMGGAGFDAQIMTDTDPKLKSTIGGAAYFVAAAKHLVALRRPVQITIDDQPTFGRKMRAVLIANCGEIQGGINIASKTTARDGQLEVIIIAPRTLLAWGALSLSIMTRRYKIAPILDHKLGKKVKLNFLKHPQPVEVDGDIIGEAKTLSAEILPQVLQVHTP